MADGVTVAAIIISAVSGIMGVVAGVIGARYTLRKDLREQEEHDDAEADRTIELLREQNRLLQEQNAELKCQADAREAGWLKRENEWQRREKSFEERINHIDLAYRDLVLTVTTMGFCAKAATCSDYDPGDRGHGKTK